MENGFQDDPALAGIFIRRVLLHWEDLTIKTKVEALATSNRKLADTVGTAAGEAKKAANDVKQLRTSLTAVERKLEKKQDRA